MQTATNIAKQPKRAAQLTTLTCTRKSVDIDLLRDLQSRLRLRDDLETLANLFELTGNSTRLRILYLLSQAEELCVCDLADVLGMTVSAVSHQLRRLRDRHLVASRKDPPTIYYSLEDSPFVGRLKQFLSGGD